MSRKEQIVSFLWQHVLLLVSLCVMTLGVAVCVRSMLGSSVISTLPYVFETAGKQGLGVPRKKFEPVQLFQLLVGFVFGSLIDLNMLLTTWLVPTDLWAKIVSQVLGCTILGIGIALEVRCGSVTMPGEGFPVAVSQVTGVEFPKVKIWVDCSLVILAVIFSYVFFGAWQWYIVGIGTLFAMVYVGMVVRTVGKHLGWFDRILAYQPGFRRYVYGLARYLFKQK